MKRWLCNFILKKILGWKIHGHFPKNIKKSIVLASPHTTNWDFPYGIYLRNIEGVMIGYFIKNTFIKPPLGGIMKWLGAVPVDRSKSNNMVDAMIETYNKHETLHINIAPEGTRKKVDRLKTGFYHIAKGANVPLVCVRFDWSRRIFTWSKAFYVTGDFDEDMKIIDNFFRGAVGYIPEDGYLYEERDQVYEKDKRIWIE